MNQKLSRIILFHLLKWSLIGNFPKLPKYIVAVVPHTSWVDFFLGLLVRSVSGEDIRFVGKKELFSPLTGWFFKYLGGVPVDRSGNRGSVESIIEVFNSHKKFRIALAPEGTRKKVNKLRTGYYFIARELKIPIVPVAFDYENRKVIVYENFYASKNHDEDLIKLENLFKGIGGYVRSKSF